jgi:hypothetical protein
MIKDNALLNADMNDTVSFSAQNNALGLGGNYYDWDDWYRWYPETYNHYYHTTVVEKPNAFELSFKIVSKMLEKKIIEKLTVRQFIETINEIAKLI